MSPDFSEFSYGYAVTEELVRAAKASVIAAPVFPSLQEEGKAGGGYDLKLPLAGRPIFLQFKLSDYLEKKNAKEHRDGVLPVPYYRMHLRPTRYSDQHNLLLDLEYAGETVFYIAPEFHRPAELNDFYLRKVVIPHSAAFSPRDIGPLPDDLSHYLVFARGAPNGFRCSENPIEVKKRSLAQGLEPVLRERDVRRRSLGEDGFRQIAKSMVDVLAQSEKRIRKYKKTVDVEGVRRIVDERPPVDAVRYMARTFYDAELVVLR